jgi:N-carbamoyl-L-amino-acid hydrolase
MGSNLANRTDSLSRRLIALSDEAIRGDRRNPASLPSGPLHDAAEVARTGVPVIMMFVQSLHGISHNKMEDTKEEHLELAEKAMQWIVTR